MIPRRSFENIERVTWLLFILFSGFLNLRNAKIASDLVKGWAPIWWSGVQHEVLLVWQVSRVSLDLISIVWVWRMRMTQSQLTWVLPLHVPILLTLSIILLNLSLSASSRTCDLSPLCMESLLDPSLISDWTSSLQGGLPDHPNRDSPLFLTLCLPLPQECNWTPVSHSS